MRAASGRAATEVVGEWNGAKVACGTGDNMAAALGLGLQPGVAVLSLGTSGTAYAVSDTSDDGCQRRGGRVRRRQRPFLPLACTLNATKVTDAIARLLGVDHAEFDRLALAAPPGAGGVTLLPYFDGERTPNLPKSTGLVTGLRSDVSREQMARAAVEGVVCGLLDALDALGQHRARGRPTGRRWGPQRGIPPGGGRSVRPARRASPTPTRPLPTGACVQAAAVALGITHREVAERWGLGERHSVGRAVRGHRRSARPLRRVAFGDPSGDCVNAIRSPCSV